MFFCKILQIGYCTQKWSFKVCLCVCLFFHTSESASAEDEYGAPPKGISLKLSLRNVTSQLTKISLKGKKKRKGEKFIDCSEDRANGEKNQSTCRARSSIALPLSHCISANYILRVITLALVLDQHDYRAVPG